MQIEGLKASLVWDGGDSVFIPPEMGTPRPDQMQGTAIERVSEVSCRVCYDSLGKKRSRSSEDNLAHIREVQHLSVVEHPNKTTFLRGATGEHVLVLLNRPGIWTRLVDGGIRLTTNPRAILEWDMWTELLKIDSGGHYPAETASFMGAVMRVLFHRSAPMIIDSDPNLGLNNALHKAGLVEGSFVEPETAHEMWVSLFMSGSRGFSHEQVRHGNFTAISQRSTRYVDESKSPWVWHPLLHKYLNDPSLDKDEKRALRERAEETQERCQAIYKRIVKQLQPWLAAELDTRQPGNEYNSFTARKQARGAARGFLGNALLTEMIFSASVAQWLHMLRMRAADAADAEIRLCYAQEAESVLEALCSSRYKRVFESITLQPAGDGLGRSLVGGGAK